MLFRSSGRSLLLAALTLLSATAYADTLQITFEGKVTSIEGTVSPSVSLGSSVKGIVSVDLATLPPDDHPFPTLGWYRYNNGDPGFTISFDTGTGPTTFSSLNASTESGLAPGIFVTDITQSNGYQTEDSVAYQLQQAGSFNAITLNFVDSVSPFNMLSSDAFPLSLKENEITTAEFVWYEDGRLPFNDFHATLESFQFTVVPEPPITALLTIGLTGAFIYCLRIRQSA